MCYDGDNLIKRTGCLEQSRGKHVGSEGVKPEGCHSWLSSEVIPPGCSLSRTMPNSGRCSDIHRRLMLVVSCRKDKMVRLATSQRGSHERCLNGAFKKPGRRVC